MNCFVFSWRYSNVHSFQYSNDCRSVQVCAHVEWRVRVSLFERIIETFRSGCALFRLKKKSVHLVVRVCRYQDQQQVLHVTADRLAPCVLSASSLHNISVVRLAFHSKYIRDFRLIFFFLKKFKFSEQKIIAWPLHYYNTFSFVK